MEGWRGKEWGPLRKEQHTPKWRDRIHGSLLWKILTITPLKWWQLQSLTGDITINPKKRMMTSQFVSNILITISIRLVSFVILIGYLCVMNTSWETEYFPRLLKRLRPQRTLINPRHSGSVAVQASTPSHLNFCSCCPFHLRCLVTWPNAYR